MRSCSGSQRQIETPAACRTRQASSATMSSTSSKRCAPATVLEIVISARSSASSGRSGRTRGSAAGVSIGCGASTGGRPAVEHALERGDGHRAELRAGVAAQLRARLLGESARRYGRSEVIACQASQTKQMRLASGTSSPASPSG